MMLEQWPLKTLGELCTIVNGGTPKSKVTEYWGGEVNWTTPAEMGKMTTPYIDDTKRKITELGLEKSSAKLFPPYSVILSTRAPIGHLAINSTHMSTNQGCKTLVPKDKLDHKYLYYFLYSNKKLLDSLGKGTTFKELSGKNMKNVKIPFPTLEEQQQIVNILDEALDNIRENKKHIVQNLKNITEISQSILNSILASEQWPVKLLGEVCKLRNGRAYKKIELLDQGKDRVLRVGNFFTNKHWYYSDLELDETKFCETGDLLYAWSASFGPRIWEGERSIFHYHIWRVDYDEKILDKKYLYYWFLWDVDKIKSEQGAGTTMIHVSMKSMNARQIPIPPLEEQQRIVRTLDEAFENINHFENSFLQALDLLKELEQAILQEAFNGNLTMEITV